MNSSVVIPSFILMHIFVGKMVSIPYGLLKIPKWYLVPLVIVIYDVFLTVFFTGVYEIVLKAKFIKRIIRVVRQWINRVLNKSGTKRVFKSERNLHSNLLRRAKDWGQLGVVFIAAIPFTGGGVWSASLLAAIMKLGKIRRGLLIIAGSMICCTSMTIGFFGVKKLILMLSEVF